MTSGGYVVFLLVTVLGVGLGLAYATTVGRRLGLDDWRRWALLVPVWVLYVVVLVTADMKGLVAEAYQSFAIGCVGQTLMDVLGALRQRRIDPPTRRGRSVAPPL